MAMADIDIESFEKAVKAIRETAEGGRIEEEGWYNLLRNLNEAALLSLRDPQRHDAFFGALGYLMDSQDKLQGLDRKLLQFGIVIQLRTLSLNSHATQTREQTVACIAAFAHRCNRSNWENSSPDVFEAILDAVRVLHAKDVRRRVTRPFLEMMCECDRPEFEVTHVSPSGGADGGVFR